jgi:uncharacterized protein (TIGR00251 family)
MNLSNFIRNGLLKIKVIPHSSRNELVKVDESELKLYLKAAPEKGKANKEVIRFFKKKLGLRVEIRSGEKSREKLLRVLD